MWLDPIETLTAAKEWVKFSSNGDFERKEVFVTKDLSALRWQKTGTKGYMSSFFSDGSSLAVSEMRRLSLDKTPGLKTAKLGLTAPPRQPLPVVT